MLGQLAVVTGYLLLVQFVIPQNLLARLNDILNLPLVHDFIGYFI